MVDTVQIGRKLTYKRKERRLLSRAVQQIVMPTPPAPVQSPPRGALAALVQKWKEEADLMTPEEIAAEDAAYADVAFSRLSLPVPDVSAHD